MKNTKVELVPLTAEDREQFILDNQWAFKYGALQEFGERDDHLDGDGEIISRKTIERCIDAPNSETYRIVVRGKKVGGVILKIDKETHHNELEILFILPDEHSKG
ncbi:MAG: GNAT family N-acetyltransferase, partial [Clostridia bacterium]|nr:GNAT family N-acetyltransferase [Clostridia bacterium]